MSSPRRVVFAPVAARELDRLPGIDRVRTAQRIAELALDPAPPQSRPIVDTAYRRIRVGDVRVVYALDDDRREVIVVRVARRSGSTYRRLKG